MRSAKFHVQLADGGHADEIVSAREETREGAGERNLSPRSQAHAHANHVLLCDVAFKKSLRSSAHELVTVRGVLHVRIQRDHAWVYLRERFKRIAKGLACGYIFSAHSVRRFRRCAGRLWRCAAASLRKI